MAFFPAFAELDPGKMGVKAAAPFLSQPVPDGVEHGGEIRLPREGRPGYGRLDARNRCRAGKRSSAPQKKQHLVEDPRAAGSFPSSRGIYAHATALPRREPPAPGGGSRARGRRVPAGKAAEPPGCTTIRVPPIALPAGRFPGYTAPSCPVWQGRPTRARYNRARAGETAIP